MLSRIKATSIFCLLTVLTGSIQLAQAESLFRANASFQENVPYTPSSLIAAPIAKTIGDFVTITISESSSQVVDAELKVNRTQVISENGSSMFNNMVKFFADKLPFGGETVKKYVSTPSFDGLNNANATGSKAESTRTSAITDKIACQVVQIMPNGMLMVQGHKVVDVNRDRQDLFVSGIVNPFYLDKTNTIASSMVGNFQMVQGGKGVISRQQSDGIANKIYQFFN